MKIDFTERNVTVPDSWREYAEKKMGKLNRYFRDVTDVRVTIRKEREKYRCETTLHADSMYFRASVDTTDMYASLDSCVSSIDRQIRKHRTKLEKRLHSKAFEPHEDYDIPDETEAYNLLRRKSFNMKPMTSEEAILQMQLLSHAFFMFRDSENSGAVSVVYCRNDGGYGIISEA